MADICVLQGSLRHQSHTRIVCNEFVTRAHNHRLTTDVYDLRELNMDFCDGRPLEEYNTDMQGLHGAMALSSIIIIGMPVYNFSMSGVVKNILDITSKAMTRKHIGLLVNAGGPHCYMAGSDLMQSMYYEVGATTLTPIVYTRSQDFIQDNNENIYLDSEKPQQKLDELVNVCQRILQ